MERVSTKRDWVTTEGQLNKTNRRDRSPRCLSGMYKSLEKTPAVARKETPRRPETTVHHRLDEFILYCNIG